MVRRLRRRRIVLLLLLAGMETFERICNVEMQQVARRLPLRHAGQIWRHLELVVRFAGFSFRLATS